jgi:hypothetical protein
MKRSVVAYGVDEPTLVIEVDTGEEKMSFQQQRIQNMSDEDAHRQELMRRRLENPDEKKQFRKAFAFKAGADYSTLKPFCEDVIVCIDGFADHTDVVRAKLELALADYDSDRDVLVVIGRSIDNLMVGLIVAEKVRQKPNARQSFAIAVYYGFSYRFYEVYLDPTIETHRIQIK